MGVSGVGPCSASSIAATASADDVSLLVLRKAMDAGASSALQLIAALPSMDPHKGTGVDLRM